MSENLKKYFKNSDLEKTGGGYYVTEIELDNKVFEIALTISTQLKNVDKNELEKVENYIENLKVHQQDITDLLIEDFKAGGETRNYIDLHVKLLDEEDIADLIQDADKKLSIEEKLLSALDLMTIDFIPEKNKEMDIFAVYDYILGACITDCILTVYINKDNTVVITIDS
ncbi:hypothetical protein B0A67_21395 [Flavobacterium aquidurense]|jgi:hypothetical protein|uniref:DUF2004 domain-containing protein n=1 Tax=Flavobacterium aquidurense TaxID=362413 RepID=UPI000918BF62|nr:DUF2004 domain-containing protein [Flavobacterium aquidurense]OXA68158.1 hypothetical protein B0A67_21395 [Flavobacterium aquidurense]SHH59109.1 Protein of unknown function [Flavobacterium frigidimaris]